MQFMKRSLLARLVLPVVMISQLLLQSGALAGEGAASGKVSGVGEQVSAKAGEGSRQVRKQPIAYAAYLRLVTRAGVPGHGGGKGRKAAQKPAALTRAGEPAPLAAVAPAAVAPRQRGGDWKPGIAEVRELLGSSRDLAGANLRGMNLAGLDLRGAVLAGADLYMANLDGALLHGANLRGASLEMATMRGASLKGAKLAGAGLFKANLESANLQGADLTGVYAVCVNMKGAQIAGATLRGGSFTRAVTGLEPGTETAPVAERGREVAPPASKWSVALLEF
jgi:hypothetical protein